MEFRIRTLKRYKNVENRGICTNPQMRGTVSRRLHAASEASSLLTTIQAVPPALNDPDHLTPEICVTASRKFETDPELLITRLSFSHIKEIMSIDYPFERFFYELECIKGVWSVRELRRQIDTKLFGCTNFSLIFT